MEEWRVIAEAPRYSVSSEGRVRNDRTGRFLRAGINSDGYLSVVLARDGLAAISRKVHRLVAEAFISNPDGKPEVNHRDEFGTKTDNSVGNLEWNTKSENQRHAFANGLHPGRRGGLIRVVETGEVFETQAEVAAAIGGHQAAVSRVLKGLQKFHMGYSLEYTNGD